MRLSHRKWQEVKWQKKSNCQQEEKKAFPKTAWRSSRSKIFVVMNNIVHESIKNVMQKIFFMKYLTEMFIVC